MGRPLLGILLSMLRQMGLLIPLILLLPRLWGVIGIWLAAPVSDLLSSSITLIVVASELRRFKEAAP